MKAVCLLPWVTVLKFKRYKIFKKCRPFATLLLATVLSCCSATVSAGEIEQVLSGGEFSASPEGKLEVFGKEVTVAFPGLPAGIYTVEVEAADNYFDENGKRVMNIRAGDTVLGNEVDLFKMAGKGNRVGDEVVELYVSRTDAAADSGLPIRALRAFKRLTLQPGETKSVRFTLTPFQFAFVNKDGRREVAAGKYTLGVGGSQQAAQSAKVIFKKTITNPAYVNPQPAVVN